MKTTKKITVTVILVIIIALLGTGCFLFPPKIPKEKMIDVELTYEVIMVDGKAIFEITTNLPDDARLWMRLSGNDDGFEQDETILINGGKGRTGEFSNDGAPLNPGKYTVNIILSTAENQSEKFQLAAGKEYEYLTGDLVHNDGGGKSIFIAEGWVLE